MNYEKFGIISYEFRMKNYDGFMMGYGVSEKRVNNTILNVVKLIFYLIKH